MPADLATELLDLMDDVVIGEEIRRRTEGGEVHSGTVDEFPEGAGWTSTVSDGSVTLAVERDWHRSGQSDMTWIV